MPPNDNSSAPNLQAFVQTLHHFATRSHAIHTEKSQTHRGLGGCAIIGGIDSNGAAQPIAECQCSDHIGPALLVFDAIFDFWHVPLARSDSRVDDVRVDVPHLRRRNMKLLMPMYGWILGSQNDNFEKLSLNPL